MQEEPVKLMKLLDLCERNFMGHTSHFLLHPGIVRHGLCCYRTLRRRLWGWDLVVGMDLLLYLLNIYLPFSFPGHSGLQPTGNALSSSLEIDLVFLEQVVKVKDRNNGKDFGSDF